MSAQTRAQRSPGRPAAAAASRAPRVPSPRSGANTGAQATATCSASARPCRLEDPCDTFADDQRCRNHRARRGPRAAGDHWSRVRLGGPERRSRRQGYAGASRHPPQNEAWPLVQLHPPLAHRRACLVVSTGPSAGDLQAGPSRFRRARAGVEAVPRSSVFSFLASYPSTALRTIRITITARTANARESLSLSTPSLCTEKLPHASTATSSRDSQR